MIYVIVSGETNRYNIARKIKYMFRKMCRIRAVLSAGLIAAFLLTSISASAQDLVPVSSLTGGSSVFVFRKTTVRRVVAFVKPVRSKAQRLESVVKIKKQYETLAKTAPRTNRAKVVDPDKLGPKGGKDLPPVQASKLFAGVGEYYLTKGDYEQSFDFFRDAIRLDDKNETAKVGYSEALGIKGNDLLANDKAELAKGVFLEAIKYNPKNAAAYFGLGDVYAGLNQQAEAIAAYEKSLASDKDLTEIYVPLGILYYQTGEIAKADDLLSKALPSSGGNAETQFFLGLIRSSQNKNDQALAAFQKATTIDPNYADGYFHTGETLVKLKRFAEAVSAYQKAVTLKPTYFDALVGLGGAYSELANYPEAVTAYKAAAKLKNDNWEVFAGLGEAYRQTGKFEDAEANFNLAALFLTRVKDYNKETLADLYSKTGFSIGQQCDINIQRNVACKWPSAIKALQKAVDITNSPIDYVNLGWAYFRAAHPDAENKNMAAARPNLDLARAALEKAMTGSPAVVDYALQNLAAVEIDLGDGAGAIDTLNKLLVKHPEDNFMRYQLGVAYYKGNDFASAEKWFREALNKDPNYVFALTALGETLISRKNGKEVRKVIDRLRPLDADAASRLELKLKASRL